MLVTTDTVLAGIQMLAQNSSYSSCQKTDPC